MKSLVSSFLTFSLLLSQTSFAKVAISAATAKSTVSEAKNLDELIEKKLGNLTGEAKAQVANPRFRERLKYYLKSLRLEGDLKLASETISRLFQSSTQFVLCEDIENWECLEKKPEITPATVFRQETSNDLGQPVLVAEPLRIESYFTERWSRRIQKKPINEWTVANALADKIMTHAKDGLYLALYGIDDIDDSMKPVFDAVQDRVKNGIKTKAVVDVANEGAPNSFLRTYDVKFTSSKIETERFDMSEIDFSYFEPADKSRWAWHRPEWMDKILTEKPDPKSLTRSTKFDDDLNWILTQPGGADAIRLAFQYKETRTIVQMINQGTKSNEEARARLEFPMDSLMHNKFVVMKSGDQMGVWSGTANIARTCMGDENNANMSIFINNTEVAKTFLDEFEEMHAADPTNEKLKTNAPTLVTGRFHQTKRPNTKRYFKFEDGHELRVHFSPTDDGEHRAILPMIYAAKKGDFLRISMFGAGGIEVVRALQMAAARGVKIRIVLDNTTGSQPQGWIKNPSGNLLQPNPYLASAKENIDLRLSYMPDRGSNHHKSASLTRADGRVDTLIVGSQNWSASGNDENDENMVTIRHRLKSLKVGEEFNQNFDLTLFPLAAPITISADGKIERVKEAR